ncbi:MAG: acyl-CoA synthetase [Alphaproteobacteria bacterium]|nr:MAG: acyl-CoA synthetase [Alphaproteobacteria bacterium]
MAPDRGTYLSERENFQWDRPDRYNFVKDTFANWAEKQGFATALYWTNHEGDAVQRSFQELLDDAAKAAMVLTSFGVEKGDTVIVVMSREQNWWEIVLGCLQIGAVVSPGTTQLTAKDMAYRLEAADAKALITTSEHVERADKAAAQINWPGVKVCSDAAPGGDWKDYSQLRSVVMPLNRFADTAASDPALCYFTSGTTGQPKMTVHRCDYPMGHAGTGGYWLRARPGELIWNLSDTGWAKAAWSSLFAPWICGAGVFAFHGGAFDVNQTLEYLGKYPVSTLCAPPTAYRMFAQHDLSAFKPMKLTRCVSAGEPLNPEIIDVWKRTTGLEIFEGYGQTETVLLCGNFDGMEIRPGSMGLPAPGIDLQVIDENGDLLPANQEGDIAVNVADGRKPVGMFTGYLHDEERTAAVYRGSWYLTGDRAIRDEDGYFWFVGRADDVILSSGYRIGPFEVESILLEHPAVAESAVVASPDPTRGEVVKAFVILAKGHEGSDDLARELQDFVKSSTAPYKYPRKIEFVSELPKTISGKIRRKELKEKEWQKASGKTA